MKTETNELIKLHRKEELEYLPEWNKVWMKEKRIKMVLKLISPNGRVLDIGSRWGDVTNEIYSKNSNVIGMELVDDLVKLAKKNFPHLKFIQGNANKIPFAPISFDSVFIGETIEHVIDQDKVIKEIKRVLKPNGELILTTPNMVSLRNRIKFVFGKQIDYNKGHINLLIKKQLIELLETNGFGIVYFKGDGISLTKIKLPCFYKNWADIFVVKAVKR